MIFDRLQQFRQTLYGMLGRGKDALFDLMDATVTSPDVSSFVRLSQNPLFRRQWPSLYHSSKIKLGHSYSTKARIPQREGSWVLPLRHERVTSFETPVQTPLVSLAGREPTPS